MSSRASAMSDAAEPGPGVSSPGTPAYAPMTPEQLAQDLGVGLSQRGQPRLGEEVPKRFVYREEAEARGMSLYYDGAACRFSHQAAKSVANGGCVDCARMRRGLDPIYPKSKAQEFRAATKTTNAQKAAAPIVFQQPAAPEPSAADQKFLAQLDTLRDMDAAAKACGTTRGLIEARASSNPIFRAALDDLCTRRDIPRTRAVDPQAFVWTNSIEQQLVKRYVDTGLLEQARNELGIAASDYHAHLVARPEFAAAIAAAEPTARQTLRERAMASAERGNDRLAKLLEDYQEDMFTDPTGRKVSYINPEQCRADLTTLLADVRKMFDREDGLRDVIRANNAKRAGAVVADPTPSAEDLT
jgi:hypothetical protein